MRNWLNKARYTDQRIQAISKQVRRIQASLEGKATVYSDMPKGSGTADWTDKANEAIMLADELQEEIRQYRQDKLEVAAVIDTIEDTRYHLIMELYYIRNVQTWEKVARMVPCDITTALRWHGRAVALIEPEIKRRIESCYKMQV